MAPRRAWLTASIAAGFVSILIAVSGGVVTSVGGVRVSARSWKVPAVIGLLTGLVWAWRARRSSSVADDLVSIARWLEDTTGDTLQIEDGSLYPALYRLENRGWIKAEWTTSELGRRVKAYRLTAAGRRRLSTSVRAWEQFAGSIAKVLGRA